MRYTLITYRPNSSYPACSRGCCGYNETGSLFERTDTSSREEIISAFAASLCAAVLHETEREYDTREHHLYINGYHCDPAMDLWDIDDEDAEALHTQGKAIFAEAEAECDRRTAEARLAADRKAVEEAERKKAQAHADEVARLARLTQERDALAKRLGVGA